MSDLPVTELPNKQKLGFNRFVAPSPDEKQKPTFTETSGAAFRQYNDVYRGISWAIDKTKNPYRDTIEEGYNPIEEGMLEGVPEQYWSNVLSAKTKIEAERVRKNIFQELEDKDTLSRSGIVSNMVSTLGATFLSPTTLIPAASTVKYAKYTNGITANAINAAKTLAPAAAIQNAILTTTKETEGLNEWATDTITDTFFATTLGGALGAFATKGIHNDLSMVKGFFKAIEDNVDIKLKVSDKGEFEGLLAANKGTSVGAASNLAHIQEMLDQGVAFKNNKFIKKAYGFAQPIIEGLTSDSPHIRAFTDKLFAHNFTTAKGDISKIAEPSAENLQRFWRGTYESLQVDTKNYWLKYVGVKGPGKGIQGTVGSWSGKWMPEAKFNEEVAKSIRRNGTHEIPEVASAAKDWIDRLYDPMWEEVKKRNPTLQDEQYTNIARYLNRVYNRDLIIDRKDDFLRDLTKYLTDSNDRLREIRKPINDLKKQLREKRRNISLLSETDKKTAQSEIKQLKSKLNAFEVKIQDDIRTGKIGIDLLDSQPKFSEKQKEAGTRLEKPVKEARKQLSEAKKTKNPESIQKAREKLQIAKLKLEESLFEPDIDKAIYKDTRKGRVLKDMSEMPKLRSVMTDTDIKVSSQSIMDTILQENDEQLVGQIFDRIIGGAGGSPLKSRALLWNDALAEPWLINDINVLGGLYSEQLSKRIHLDDIFGGNYKQGVEDLLGEIKNEKKVLEDTAYKMKDEKARQEKLREIDKDFKKKQNFIKNSVQAYLGNYDWKGTKKARVSNSLKQFAASTLLGNVPILQLTEFFTPMYKFMFKEFIMDGLAPTLTRMKETVKLMLNEYAGGDISYVRGIFQDAGLGNNMALGSRMEALFGYGANYNPKTKIERHIQNMANVSTNFSLTNMISDFQETSVAFTSQSKTIRTLERWAKGEKLTPQEIDRLDLLRLNPEKYGKQILQQFKKHGEKIDGGFKPNFHKWDKEAFDARQVFSAGLEKEVRSLITKPNLADVPFGFRDPVISLMTQFMSWTFAATQNFVVPTLTSPDAQKFMGIILMMSSSSLIGPIRQLVKGEEVDTSFETLAFEALGNSGVLGFHYDLLQKLNAGFDIPYIRKLTPERYKGKGAFAMIGGPTLGIADSILNIANATLNGEMNAKDGEKAFRFMAPFLGAWWTRSTVNDVFQSTGLPKDRKEAKKLKGD